MKYDLLSKPNHDSLFKEETINEVFGFENFPPTYIIPEEVFNNEKELNESYEDLVGKTIEIVSLDDPYAERYIGKRGVVQSVSEDPWGDVRLDGTWGGIAIYPHCDRFKVVD